MWIAETAGCDRAELARQATELARQALHGVDVEIFWDGMWMRRVGGDYFPDPDLFRGGTPDFARWRGQAAKHLADAQDYWFHVYQPQAGDVIVDIGAGRGEDVLAFSRAVGVGGRVWALEPHPVTFAALEKCCQWNRLDNVTALRYACTAHPARMEIETLPVWESNFVREGPPSATSHSVVGEPFDAICTRHGIERIDYLKMNIEGAERLALPGAREALRRARFVTIAAHDFRAARGEGGQFRTLAFVRAFLADAGFELITRDGDARYYVPYHVHGKRWHRL